MKTRRGPDLEPRRAADFRKELEERARTWIPSWELGEGQGDFGRALLEVAARFNAEVAERLDRAGEKIALGLFDWLAIRPKAARPARLPIVFKLADVAREPLPAPAGVMLQVNAAGRPVVLETEKEVRLVPGSLDMIVGVDPQKDAFYLPPPGLSSLAELEPGPTRWSLKGFASPRSTTLQLDPALGLTPETVLEIGGEQFVVKTIKEDLVTIEPPVPASGFGIGTVVTKVSAFAPFGGARDQQEHVLYIGDADLLNIEAAATIDVVMSGGQEGFGADVVWHYWGKRKTTDEKKDPARPDDETPQWRELRPAGLQEAGALTLDKPAGALDELQIGGKKSRWIRARITHALELLSAEAVQLRINAPKDPSSGAATGVPVDVMVNSTPSPPENFHPLGREPRLFDTFYMGSAEGFSKKGAVVTAHFHLVQPGFDAMATYNAGGAIGSVLAGIDEVGFLHLFKIEPDARLKRLFDRPATRPSNMGIAQKLTSTAIRPVMWTDTGELLVAVVAENDEVWVWRERGSPRSSWETSLGAPTGEVGSHVTGLLVLGTLLVALRGEKLFARSLAAISTWESFGFGAPAKIKAIAPIIAATNRSPTASFLAITTDGKLYAGSMASFVEISGANIIATDVGPIGVQFVDNHVEVVAVSKDRKKLFAWNSTDAAFTSVTFTEENLAQEDQGAINMTLMDARASGTKLTAYVRAGKDRQPSVLLSWVPFDTDLEPSVFRTRNAPLLAEQKGSVAVHDSFVFAPGADAPQIFAAAVDGARYVKTAPLDSFVSAAAVRGERLDINRSDTLIVEVAGTEYIVEFAGTKGMGRDGFESETFYWLKERIASSTGVVAAVAVRTTNTLSGRISASRFVLDVADTVTKAGTWLWVEKTTTTTTTKLLVRVISVTSGVARVDPPLTGAGLVDYWTGVDMRARITPGLLLDASNDNWPASVLDRGDIYFPALNPERQHVIASAPKTNDPQGLAFELAWVADPTASTKFIVDGEITGWTQVLGDDTSNPKLSWEYWNGTGWWTLPVNDRTAYLKKTGTVTFKVPSDLQPTDWSGKTNHWVRARLIGGDYGHETVTVKSTDTSATEKTQTIQRSTEGVQAPYVEKLIVRYTISDVVTPTLLLTKDSNTLRDQSDANRTPGAMIDVFTPLIATLRRLETGPASGTDASKCASECECPPARAGEDSAAVAEDAESMADAPDSRTDRPALFLGFNAKLQGEPVNMLFKVELEMNHQALAPLIVDTVVRGRFVPVLAEDKTRALGESGVLSMSFPVEPVATELFGKTLTWLRLTPAKAVAGGTWSPRLSGAYLNAVWAAATETLTRELVGSSAGQPNLMLMLARPPVLHDTLELRVREPLGEEERKALREKHGDAKVLSDVENLPGDWVLWTQVNDPADSEPRDRVYSLDETTGVLRFGDGLHGAIPPIGQDSIVAFTYKRTEPPAKGSDMVPANEIAPRSVLSLVSPLQGVEAAVAADGAAGGAAPESTERVLRFATAGLRHRGRAVTARDFEDIALQSSAAIVQARCFVRGGRQRLVIVMRGVDPRPDAAERRELRRVLLETAPAQLGARGVLTVTGPRVRRLRVELRLSIASLDLAGGVTREVKRALGAFFDSATGGVEGAGWPLGASPSEEDIGLALVDVSDLEGIEDIDLLEVDAKGVESPWDSHVEADALVMLADDAVEIVYKTDEVAA